MRTVLERRDTLLWCSCVYCSIFLDANQCSEMPISSAPANHMRGVVSVMVWVPVDLNGAQRWKKAEMAKKAATSEA